jgi:STE24 endopeptidase
MSSSLLFYVIIVIIASDFIIERILEYLNIKNMSPTLPERLKGIYDEEKYKKFQNYKKAKDRIGLLSSTLSFVLILAMLLFGGFAWLDSYVRQYFENPIWIALIFFGILMFASDLIGLPIAWYSVFTIEEKFGFNKTTVRTFILDKIKGWIIGIIIGGGLLAGLIWIYGYFEESFWYYAWIGVSVFSLLMIMFYSNLIVPLFNKQTPLEEGTLRNKIQEFSNNVGFKLNNIYVIDGSKRSTKANAYFTGMGRKKRVVLFDTLINDLEEEEIVAVLAHEVGHYKKKHTLWGFVSSVINTGLILFLFSIIVKNPEIYEALGVQIPGIHIALIVFAILLSPLNLVVGITLNIWSRHNEYEADNFAKDNYDGGKLISALKKISVNALSNLTPHPIYEFVYYSHPSLLRRINRILGK